MAEKKQYMTPDAVAACESILRKGAGHRVEIMTTADGVRVFDLARKTTYQGSAQEWVDEGVKAWAGVLNRKVQNDG